MGWYIGNQTVGQVTVTTTDGLTTNEAYLGLRDIYSLYRETKIVNDVDVAYYRTEIGISVFANKQSQLDGKRPIDVVGLRRSIFVEILESKMTEELSGSVLGLLMSKLIPAIYEIKIDWVDKLVEDF